MEQIEIIFIFIIFHYIIYFNQFMKTININIKLKDINKMI